MNSEDVGTRNGQTVHPEWRDFNYAPEPAHNLRVSLGVSAAKVTLFTPERVPAAKPKFEVLGGRTQFTVPELGVYALVVIQPQREPKRK